MEHFQYFKELGKNNENIEGPSQIIYKQAIEDSGHLQCLWGKKNTKDNGTSIQLTISPTTLCS